jgi:hypothetical protein
MLTDTELGLEDNISENDIIILVSSDNVRFELIKHRAFLSKLLKVMIENDTESMSFNISVQAKPLEKIVEYLNYHKGVIPPDITRPIISTDLSKLVCKWDSNFIENISSDTNVNFIFDVVLGANYMDIPSLLELGCAKVAIIIKDKEQHR